jgi:hypothetical protein
MGAVVSGDNDRVDAPIDYEASGGKTQANSCPRPSVFAEDIPI